MQTIQPRNGYLHIQIIQDEQSLVIVPEKSEQTINAIFKVIAQAPDGKISVNPGDEILLVNSVALVEVPGKGHDEALVHESAVLAVITNL